MTVRVSVCMATYNGAQHVAHQLRLILAELEPQDEVVIVDDASADDTVAIIEGIDDARVRILHHRQNRGYVRAFEAALLAADGDVLFLADQDDEWITGRRRLLVEAALTTGVAAGDLVLLGGDQPLASPWTRRPWLLGTLPNGGSLRNELRLLAGDIPYFGCAMAFRREFTRLILPFPDFLTESHDLWIATVGNSARAMTHVTEPVLRRRLHAGNASAPRPRGFVTVLRSRWMLLRAWREAVKRVRRDRVSR